MHLFRSGSELFAYVSKREPLYPDWASQHSLVLERDPLTTRKKA